MARAQKAEARQATHPYLLAIIDGNDLCFRGRAIKAGPEQAIDVANSIVREMRDHANLHHKYNLPQKIVSIVQIYVDLERLVEELVRAEAIDDDLQLYRFVKALNSQPNISVIDCEYYLVQSKIQAAYELQSENCHCQHITLALGPTSTYYSTLEEYSGDEYTMLKTSLIKPGGGLPAQYDLPFHTTRFSSMHDLPLIPLIGDAVSELSPAVVTNTAHVMDRLVVSDFIKSPRHESASSSGDGRGSDKKRLSQAGSVPSVPSSHTSYGPVRSDTATSLHNQCHVENSPSRQHDWEIETYHDIVNHNFPSNPSRPLFANQVGTQNHVNEQDFPPLPTGPENDFRRRRSSGSSQHSDRQHRSGEVRRRRAASSTSSRDRKDYNNSPSPALSLLPALPLRNDILRNQKGQRLDARLPDASTVANRAFGSRTQRKKLCNTFHLEGSCRSNRCQFDHNPTTPDVLLVLLHKAREIPCVVGHGCEAFECCNGHYCQKCVSGFNRDQHRSYCAFRKVGLKVNDLRLDHTRTIRCPKLEHETGPSYHSGAFDDVSWCD